MKIALPKLRRWSFLFTTFGLAMGLATTSAHATNGLQVFGVGPIHLSMGGAGVAKPLDSNALYINPAGMNDVGNQADLSFTVAFPDSYMGTSLAPAGNPDAVNVKSTDDASFVPSGSLVFSTLKNNRLSLGVGAFFSSGFQVEFPVSRFPTSLTNNLYDTSARYANLRIIPGASFRVLDNLSVGVGVDINYAFLHSDSAVLQPGFPETTGRSRFDSALGIGGRIGVIYVPHSMVQLGAMYVTRSRFQKFDRYTDLLGDTGLDQPQQVHFGITVMPFEGGMFATDFRWLDWSGTGILGRSIAAGGVQWRDQYVFAGGFQYDFDPSFGFPIALRLGYNYGRSPITAAGVFRNILIPTVIEQHLTVGFGMMLGEHVGFDAAYIREFQNTVTDDGSGSPVGTGSFVGTSANAFSVGIRGTWGQKGRPPMAE